MNINTLTTAVNDSVVVDAATLSLVLPRGPYLRATLENAAISFGDFKLEGDFLFEKSIDYGADNAPGGSRRPATTGTTRCSRSRWSGSRFPS